MRWAALSLPLALAACATGEPTHRVADGALGPYSGSVEADGQVWASGKIGDLGADFAHEVSTAIDAVEQELSRAGLGLGDVVQATVFLTDMGRYAEFNAIYAARFPAPYPARACVAVAALPAGARVELMVVARR